MATNRKFYVVWEGLAPGIYDSWEECQQQVIGVKGARFKAFNTIEQATEAFRGSYEDQASLLLEIAKRSRAPHPTVIPDSIPDGAIAVDGACSGVPGPIEYRGVDIRSGREIFHVGPYAGGTNNIAEYLALIHALALLDKRGDHSTPIYSDSRTAQTWVRNRRSKTTVEPTAENARLMQILARADAWIATHTPRNPIVKWDTENWGEIPADFGRK
ncbi:MAG: ribonuclease H family protein [Muribaculaceae bacterium]|nr:ribonuclease H family protein [Muribaculaceae bacterium]